MTINEYQAQALRTESRVTADPVPYVRVVEGLMGLNGESGEAIDLMKKVLFQMNVDKLKARYPDGFNTEQSRNRDAGDI